MNIKALIPVRSGSVRVANKNIRPFAGSTLLEIKIRQMLRIPGLDGVVVNSNSDEMLEMAARLGAETVKRDEHFATSSIPINEVYAEWARHMDSDAVMVVNCTAPLVEDATYAKAVKLYRELYGEYDSLASVTPVKEFLWKDGKPLNYEIGFKPRSQDLPDNYVALNHMINIMPRQLMIDLKDVTGRKPYLLPVSQDEAVDIDFPVQFEFAEFLYCKRHGIELNPVR